MSHPRSPRKHLPAQTSHAPGLDSLRSLAIVSVIAYHLHAYHESTVPAFLVPIVRNGWMGVDLFFVLSGYLIASQLFRPYRNNERPSLLRFYRNRLLRILPAYLVVLALYFFIRAWPEDDRLAPAWQYLTFTFNLFADLSRYQGFSHVWSLCVEEHFYLFLPLIVILLMRKRSPRWTLAIIAAVLLAGMAIRGYFWIHLIRPILADDGNYGFVFMEHLYYPTYSRLDGLLAGVTLAVIRTFRPLWWNRIERHGNLTCVLGVVLTAAAIALFRDRMPAYAASDSITSVLCGYPLVACALACLVASALSTHGLLRLRIPGASLCATLAYALYLTHKALFHLIDTWFPKLQSAGWLPWTIVYGLVCVAVAAALHLAIERPFLKLRERIDKKTALRELQATT